MQAYLHMLESVFNNKYSQIGIAAVISILLAFQKQIVLFEKKITFFILLSITVALVMTEARTNPGLVLLMMAMTVISFNLGKTQTTTS
jgi:hypothetical protein